MDTVTVPTPTVVLKAVDFAANLKIATLDYGVFICIPILGATTTPGEQSGFSSMMRLGRRQASLSFWRNIRLPSRAIIPGLRLRGKRLY
jgi:hypothetical protein